MPAMAIMRYNIETIGVSILKGGLGACLLPCCLLGNVQDDLAKRGLTLSSTMYLSLRCLIAINMMTQYSYYSPSYSSFLQ